MKISSDNEVTIEYELKVEGEEEVIDSSSPGDPLRYVHGRGNLIPGLENRIEGMAAGEQRTVVVPPEEAYGTPDPEALMQVPQAELPQDIPRQPGTQLQMRSPDGHIYNGVISEVQGDTVFVDFNHPLAGKTLCFEIKVVEVKSAEG